jgi:hypothetical protein
MIGFFFGQRGIGFTLYPPRRASFLRFCFLTFLCFGGAEDHVSMCT